MAMLKTDFYGYRTEGAVQVFYTKNDVTTQKTY